MERHRNDHIKLAVSRQSIRKQNTERFCERLDSAVFEQVDQLPEGSVVLPISPCVVESTQTVAAQPATAGFIQRIGIQKRSMALDAEVFGDQRRRGAQARRADWNAGDFGESGAAYAAVFREDEVERHCDEGSQRGEVDFRLNGP